MSPLARCRAGLLAGALASAALGGCATAQTRTPSQAALARGHGFAARACAGCHGVEAVGESPNAHAPRFRELAARRSDAQLAAAIAEISRNGHLEMPPIYVTPDELADVVAYMRSLTGRAT